MSTTSDRWSTAHPAKKDDVTPIMTEPDARALDRRGKMIAALRRSVPRESVTADQTD